MFLIITEIILIATVYLKWKGKLHIIVIVKKYDVLISLG